MSGEVSVLNTSLMDIPKVGKKTYKHLETLGLKTVKDVLFFFPRSYDDRRQFPLISSVKSNQQVALLGTLSDISYKTVSKKVLIRGQLSDSSGSISLVWFNQPYLKSLLKSGLKIYVKGKCDYNDFQASLQLVVQETEIIFSESQFQKDFNRVLPVYLQ